MPSINDERLQIYLDAEKRALVSQEYQDGTQRNRLADLEKIRQGTDSLISTGAGDSRAKRSRRIVLRDL